MGSWALGARAAAFHEQLVQALTSGGNAYNSTEAANAAAGVLTRCWSRLVSAAMDCSWPSYSSGASGGMMNCLLPADYTT